jgi:hypothetical protein
MTKLASKELTLIALLGIGSVACGDSGSENENGGGSPNGTGGSAGLGGGGSAGTQATGGGAGSGAGRAGAGSGGATATGGTSGAATAGSGASTSAGGTAQGGAAMTGGSGGGAATGGKAEGGSAGAGNGGATNGGTSGAGAGGSAPGGCTVGEWPAADPSAAGPYEVVTENDVGPEAGVAGDDGTVPRFTLFRPETWSPDGLCHPVITWGNGTGSTPNLYRSLLGNLASHGFVVIGSNNENVGQGDPKPMLVGVDWVLEQNEDPSSVLYGRIDVTNIGATGHSQGAFATSSASGDSRITTNVPIEGAQVQRNLHGPAMLFCGGMDEIVPCDSAQNAFDAVTDLPAMYAEYLSVDHGSWLGRGGQPSVVETAVTAWMRVHLMADASLRSWFYGASCELCTDSGWVIQQKNMDQ